MGFVSRTLGGQYKPVSNKMEVETLGEAIVESIESRDPRAGPGKSRGG